MVFFGAGASVPLGIPINRLFYDEFLKSPAYFEASQRSDFPVRFDNAIRSTKLDPLDVEAIMSILSALASPDRDNAMLRGGKPTTAFLLNPHSESVRLSPNRQEATDLLQRLKQFIRDRCESYEVQRLHINYDSVFNALGNNRVEWYVGRGPSRRQISFDYQHVGADSRYLPAFWCFTTNYDCALEAYFQERGLDIDPGFKKVGTQFFLDAREIHDSDKRHKLVKLHGSIDMIGVGKNKVIKAPFFRTGKRTAYGETVSEEVLIYPTQEKELFRFPFIDFYYEFVGALRAADLWIFVGFSFSDLPILNLVSTEATERKKIIVVSPRASQHCRGDGGELAPVTGVSNLCPVDLEIGTDGLTAAIEAQGKA